MNKTMFLAVFASVVLMFGTVASVLEMDAVLVTEVTTFQLASTALTVTLKELPDVCALGLATPMSAGTLH